MENTKNVIVIIEDGNTRIITDSNEQINVIVLHRDTERYGEEGMVLGREASILVSSSADHDPKATAKAVQDVNRIENWDSDDEEDQSDDNGEKNENSENSDQRVD